MELIVIRHGQSHVNLGNWAELETMDTELTDLGRQQAVALRDWLKSINPSVNAFYASTMRRTRETADIIAPAIGLDPILDDRIREVGNSHMDGTPIEESALPRVFSRVKVSTSPFVPIVTDVENAESWMHFRTRVGDFIHDLSYKHKGELVYVVAHGGVIDVMFDIVFNIGLYRQCSTRSDNTSWTRFQFRADKSFTMWILHDHNRVDHLVQANLIP